MVRNHLARPTPKGCRPKTGPFPPVHGAAGRRPLQHHLAAALRLPDATGLVLGAALALLALVASCRNRISPHTRAGAGKRKLAAEKEASRDFAAHARRRRGVAVASGWVLSFALAQAALALAPSTLPAFPARRPIGVLQAALRGRKPKLEGFKTAGNMRPAVIGTSFTGFGALLADGCAIGASAAGPLHSGHRRMACAVITDLSSTDPGKPPWHIHSAKLAISAT